MFFPPGSPGCEQGRFRGGLGQVCSVAKWRPGASAGVPIGDAAPEGGKSLGCWWPGCWWCALHLLWARLFVTVFVKMHFGARAHRNWGVSKAGRCSFPFTSSSQSEVPREEIGRHQRVLGRGSTRPPRHPPRPQSHGRRAGRKGKRQPGRPQGRPRGALHNGSCAHREALRARSLNTVFFLRLSIYWG